MAVERSVTAERCLLERVLEGAHALSVGLQAFAVRFMQAVVWPLVQARVCGFQCLLLSEQGSTLTFQLRIRHDPFSLRLLASRAADENPLRGNRKSLTLSVRSRFDLGTRS